MPSFQEEVHSVRDRMPAGWFRFILDRMCEENPRNPMVEALWGLVRDHAGADHERCVSCDGGFYVQAPTVAECEVVRTVARVWVDHDEHPGRGAGNG